MAAPNGFPWSFRALATRKPGGACFAAGNDAADKQDAPITWILRWTGEWGSQPTTVIANDITIATAPETAVLLMGIDGTIVRWSARPAEEERVDSSENGPQDTGDLREIRTIADRAYVVGMRRMVYRNDHVGRWTRIDKDVRCKQDDSSSAGFNSIHGLAESDVYAVGWNGEIWHYDGSTWSQIASPTNQALNRVVCAPNGLVYACGQRGVILVGSGAEWKILEHGLTEHDFWGAAWYRERLFLSTANGIYQLQGQELRRIEIADQNGRRITTALDSCFYRLEANAEELWSAGEKMVLFSKDGSTWQELPYA